MAEILRVESFPNPETWDQERTPIKTNMLDSIVTARIFWFVISVKLRVFDGDLVCIYAKRVKYVYLGIFTVKALVAERRVAYNVNDSWRPPR